MTKSPNKRQQKSLNVAGVNQALRLELCGLLLANWQNWATLGPMCSCGVAYDSWSMCNCRFPVPPSSPSADFDFEIAAINAFRSMFPSVATYACRFHCDQALWRNVQRLGLTDDYKSGTEVGYWLILRSVMCKMTFQVHLLLIYCLVHPHRMWPSVSWLLLFDLSRNYSLPPVALGASSIWCKSY